MKNMARKSKPVTNEPKADNSFLSALKFIGLITKEVGIPSETHVHLQSNWATASNGTLAIGCPIKEDLYCCPQSKLMTEALSKCGEHFSLTQLDVNRLAIKSNKFRAVVPCIDPNLINVVGPDPAIAVINNNLKVAFDAVGVLASENGQVIYNASILLNGPSVIATDGKVILEYYHGIDLPYNLPVPKGLINPLTKTSKNLTRFGFSPSSITLWFEDDSFIKSQLYAEPWPDVAAILDQQGNFYPVPTDFFPALDAIRGFAEQGNVYFDSGVLRTHEHDALGASYEVLGLPKGPVFNVKQLALIKPYAEKIDFLVPIEDGTILMFVGKTMRGVIAGIRR